MHCGQPQWMINVINEWKKGIVFSWHLIKFMLYIAPVGIDCQSLSQHVQAGKQICIANDMRLNLWFESQRTTSLDWEDSQTRRMGLSRLIVIVTCVHTILLGILFIWLYADMKIKGKSVVDVNKLLRKILLSRLKHNGEFILSK